MARRAHPPRPPRRAARWLAVTLLVLLAVALGLGALLTHTSAGRAWVRRTVEDALGGMVGGAVRVAAVEGTLLGRGVLRGVRIYDGDGARVVALNRLEARYALWPRLLGRPLRVRALVVDGLALQLVERDGRWNLADLAREPDSDETGGWPIVIDDLRVRDGSLKVHGVGGSVRVRALALDAGVVGDADAVRVDGARLALTLVGREVIDAKITGHLHAFVDGSVETAGRAQTRRSALAWDVTIVGGAAARADVAIDVGRLAAADVRALAGGHTPPIDATGRVRARGPAERVRLHAKVATRAGDASIRGVLRAGRDGAGFGYDATMVVRALDLGRVLDRPTLAGAVHATARGSGRKVGTAGAETRLEVEVAPSVLGPVDLSRGSARVRVEPAAITIERFELESEAVRVEATGTLPVPGASHGTGASALHVRAETDDVRLLGALAGIDGLGGALQLEATLGGPADDLGATLQLDGRRVSVGDATIARVEATASAEGVDTTATDLRPARATLEATVSALAAADRRVEILRLTSRYARAGDAPDANADVTIEAREDDGRIHELRATAALREEAAIFEVARLRLQPGAAPWTLVGTPTVTFRDGGVAIEELVLASSEGELRTHGHAMPAATDLRVELERLPLDAVAADLGGTASGSVHLTGSWAAPALTVDVGVVAPAIAGVAYDEARGHLGLRAGRTDARLHVTEGGASRLAVDVGGPVELSLASLAASVPELRGRLEARGIEVAVFGRFVPSLDNLGGRLEADLTLAGAPAALELQGDVRLIEGRGRVGAIGVTYDAVDAAVRLEGTRAVIERLEVRSGDGLLRGTGGAELTAGVPTVDLRIELARFPLVRDQWGSGTASGWLWLTGTPDAPVVGGALQTEELTFRLPEESTTRIAPPDPTITVIRSSDTGVDPPGLDPAPAEPAVAADPPSFYDRAAGSIQIDISRDAWLRRSDAEIALRGWATLWKKPQEAMRAAAEIDAVRGSYTFRGKRFSLVEGRVVLAGGELDPELQLIAMHRARDHKVFVHVGGTVAAPTLRLESEPSLDQADVLAVLLFGRPSAELSGNESQALQEQTVAIASSYAAQGLSQSVAGSLGLDTLQVEAVGTGAVEETEVTAGKYLAEDIFVALSHRFGKETVDELRIEYRFLPEWSLETSGDTLGGSGVDVFWKRRY